MWRTVAGGFLLASKQVRRMFLDCFFKFIGRSGGEVAVYAFVVMSNHFHMAAELLKQASCMSSWARSGLSSFGLKYNRMNNRKGPLAQDRFKSAVTEDAEAMKRLMFYIDWNPVRAGMCDHPSKYPFSSYRYYAMGEVNAWTTHITPPLWYLELGATPEERQKRYQSECDRYYREELLFEESEADDAQALGTKRFQQERRKLLRALGRHWARRTWKTKELRYLAEVSLSLPPSGTAGAVSMSGSPGGGFA
jgi:hypothetical protein